MNTGNIAERKNPGLSRIGYRLLDNPVTRALTSPLSVDDYLSQFNPLWSVSEVRGRITRTMRETADAVTLHIRPNSHWQGHQAGQHLILGVEIGGVRYTRCFSISSAPATQGEITVSVKRNGDGLVSNYLVDKAQAGDVLHLSQARGDFLLPQDAAPLLMISGGSGITPLMAMLRQRVAMGVTGSVVFVHYSNSYADTLFYGELRALAERCDWLDLRLVIGQGTPIGEDRRGLFSIAQLDELVPDASARTALLCGPPPLMERVNEAFAARGWARPAQEQFQVKLASVAGEGQVRFVKSGLQASGAAAPNLLELAEAQGLNPPSGCRMGICHGCKCRVQEGEVRDLRNGEVRTVRDEDIQLCVHAAAGSVQLDI